MKVNTSASSRKNSGKKKAIKKGENMKVTIVSSTDKVISTFELRPWKFRSGSDGLWGSIKAIDWEAQKQFQVNCYMVEINSNPNKPNTEPAADPDEQQSPVEEERDQQAAVE